LNELELDIDDDIMNPFDTCELTFEFNIIECNLISVLKLISMFTLPLTNEMKQKETEWNRTEKSWN